jgi:hypothetical protein
MTNDVKLPDEAELFLKRLRQGLSTLTPAEQQEIVAEIRVHLLERKAQGTADLLSGFEAPEELAAGFVSEQALRGSLAQGTSWALIRALLIASRESLLALLLLFPLVLIQISAVMFVLAAGMKPFMGDELGFWAGPWSLYVGINRHDPRNHELLGWGMIPVLGIGGIILFWISNRAMRGLVRWRLHSINQAAPWRPFLNRDSRTSIA